MYAAKQNGKGRVERFDPAVEAELIEHFEPTAPVNDEGRAGDLVRARRGSSAPRSRRGARGRPRSASPRGLPADRRPADGLRRRLRGAVALGRGLEQSPPERVVRASAPLRPRHRARGSSSPPGRSSPSRPAGGHPPLHQPSGVRALTSSPAVQAVLPAALTGWSSRSPSTSCVGDDRTRRGPADAAQPWCAHRGRRRGRRLRGPEAGDARGARRHQARPLAGRGIDRGPGQGGARRRARRASPATRGGVCAEGIETSRISRARRARRGLGQGYGLAGPAPPWARVTPAAAEVCARVVHRHARRGAAGAGAERAAGPPAGARHRPALARPPRRRTSTPRSSRSPATSTPIASC